jgi:hypothetical protein
MSLVGQILPPRKVRGMSVIAPKAAVNADIFVRPVRATTGREQMQQHADLVDHLVGALLQKPRNVKAERLGGLEVYH